MTNMIDDEDQNGIENVRKEYGKDRFSSQSRRLQMNYKLVFKHLALLHGSVKNPGLTHTL